MCSDAARQAAEADNKKLELSYGRKLDALEKKIERQKMEVSAQQDELSQRRMEDLGATGEFVLGLFSRRKRSLTTSLTKHRLASQAKENRDQERKELDQLEAELDALEAEMQDQQKAFQDKWAQTVNDVDEVPLVPLKKDIYVELFGVAWLPYYQISLGGGPVKEVPAFPPAPK
jgi:phage host-nuclease inhibitor protein Gam